MNTTERSNYLFDLAYMNAMGDATRRTNVAANCKKMFLDTKKYKNSKKAKNKIRNYIDNNLKGHNISFNLTASFVVTQLSTIENKDTNFNFGNAQKLINMTAKYLFIMLYNTEDIKVRNGFSNFHCPMDRIMIDTVTKKYRKYLKSIPDKTESENKEKLLYFNIDANGKPCSELKGNPIKDWQKVAWSNLNNDTKYIYDKYQKMVYILATKE